jgi:hypothetical protein
MPCVMRPCQECGKPVLCLMAASPALTLGPQDCAHHQ